MVKSFSIYIILKSEICSFLEIFRKPHMKFNLHFTLLMPISNIMIHIMKHKINNALSSIMEFETNKI